VSGQRPALTPRTLVLDHARLAGRTSLQSITVVDGTVVAIGDEAPAALGRDADRVDLAGATVLPGLWDAHVHIEQWAVARKRLDLTGISSARAAADAVAAAARTRPSGEAIVGHGYRDGLWADALHKDLLEAAAPDRVVVLHSNDLHALWLSPAALAQIGSPEHPTGVLLEGECYRATRRLQEHDPVDLDRWVAEATREAAARGVTGIIDFEMGDPLLDWERRARQRSSDVRVVCTVYREHLEAAVARGMPSGTVVAGTDGLVEVGPLKLFVDGSLNSRTALCHDAYPDLVGGDHSHGRLETPPGELVGLLRRATDAGLDAAVHAIGDRANEIALDAFEAVGSPGRIEHAQLLGPGDAERFAALGVIAGVQPDHILGDRAVADRHWAGRTDRAFPYRALLDAGATLELGSDAPVSPLDPWSAIAAAVTRADGDDDPWHPEQRIGIEEALAASSRGRTGVRVGDPADLVVVDRDPLATPATELTSITALGTLLAGRWTHPMR
jgi:predicted amidohydrolase YtcJ